MRTSRDQMIMDGLEAAQRSERAFTAGRRTRKWIYKVKIRSGRRAIVNAEYEAWCIPHLRALVIMDQARHSETISAPMIGRIMKATMRSYREDV